MAAETQFDWTEDISTQVWGHSSEDEREDRQSLPAESVLPGRSTKEMRLRREIQIIRDILVTEKFHVEFSCTI